MELDLQMSSFFSGGCLNFFSRHSIQEVIVRSLDEMISIDSHNYFQHWVLFLDLGKGGKHFLGLLNML